MSTAAAIPFQDPLAYMLDESRLSQQQILRNALVMRGVCLDHCVHDCKAMPTTACPVMLITQKVQQCQEFTHTPVTCFETPNSLLGAAESELLVSLAVTAGADESGRACPDVVLEVLAPAWL